jgi:antitoxin CptB
MEKIILRKKILNYSINRGLKELEIIFSDFANKFLDDMTHQEMNNFMQILEQNDCDILSWISNNSQVPEVFQNNGILMQIINIENGK